jgi:hypothetical protein
MLPESNEWIVMKLASDGVNELILGKSYGETDPA